MRIGNPALKSEIFLRFKGLTDTAHLMTFQGTVNRTILLLFLVLCSSIWIWNIYFSSGSQKAVIPWIIGGTVGGFIFALITIFRKQWSPFTAPIYALLEGFALGGISSMFNAQYPGIVIQAVGLTFGILFSLLVVYKTRLIKVTENFKLGIVSATGSIFLIYTISLIINLSGAHIPFIHESGFIGIGFSLFVVVVAALNLLVDFDSIEQGVAQRVPKYMEWYAAFGLMLTLIWLYLEILELLSKLQEADD
ncbi:MAG: Bax inhibitor-1/YccA family membrane protein [bacterium]